MRATLKQYFIPHEKNNYHPHALHLKRAVLYGALGIAAKVLVIVFVLAVPLSAYMAPDVLRGQADKIVSLVNEIRALKGERALEFTPPLVSSSQAKADDMAKNHYFSHTGPDGKSVTSWVLQYDYDYEFAGENLAMGFNSAADVVAAWKKSPTHYANLIDADFIHSGIGIKSGEYDSVPTAFVAMHFGALRIPTPESKEQITKPKSIPLPPKTTTPPLRIERTDTEKGAKKDIAGVSIVKEPEPIVFDRAHSRVYWNVEGDGALLSAKVTISGPFHDGAVVVGTHRIVLEKTNDGTYEGSLVIPESPDDLFSTIISPTLLMTDANGAQITDSIDWNTIKIVSPPAIKKYEFAKSVEGPTATLFSLTEWLYRGFIVFFGIALALCIGIEYRKQLPSVIAQTVVLIGLFSFLLWV